MSAEALDESPPSLPPRAIALVGLTGVGKSTLGRRLAAELSLPFVDSDREIEQAARLSIQEIFDTLGEPAFREGERRVIARLLDGQPKVIATGGGAVVTEQTRQALARDAFTVWLRKDVEAIAQRLTAGKNRPILKGDNPGQILRRLAQEREAFYAAADLTFDLDDVVSPVPLLAAQLRARLPWLKPGRK
jgi:shikimate kinase